MLIKFYKESGKRLLSLLLALTLILPNFTGIVAAADDDPDAGTICGIAAHAHGESCFESADQLICGKEEGAIHVHVDTCHQSSSVLICTVPESEEHSHGEDCYELQTVTICDQIADVPHAHDSICYQTVQKTICTQQEHTHTADCYVPATTDFKESSEPVTETSEPSTESSTTPTGNSAGDDATEPDPTTAVAPTNPLGALLTSPAPNTLATKNAPVESLTDISGYTVPIVIYNYLYRTGAAGESLVMSHDGLFAFTGNFGSTITIGGDTTQTDENCKPTANNITVEFQGLHVNNTVTIKDVYPGGDVANKTILNVTDASSIDTLVLESTALVEMNISADTTISDLVLAANSSLIINIAAGAKLTLTNSSGGGSLWINGGAVEGNGISVGSLNLNGSQVTISQLRASGTMTLSGANITATDGTIVAPNIYATNSVIVRAKLFGFDHTITDTATMSFVGCHFSAIERVGAADDCAALVRFTEDCSIETDDVKSYVRDYTITYAVAGEGENWLKSYRVSSGKLAGEATVLTADRMLPQYTTPGYTYLGWLLAQDDENFIKELPKDQKGDLTLYPKTQPANIQITIDLMFDLEKEVFDTGDWVAAYNENRVIDEDKGTKTSIKKFTKALDTNLVLDIPNRFGYIFRGWKITGSDVTLSDTVTEYTIVYDQLTDKTEYTLNLEAVWLKDTFPLYWSFGGISLEYIEVSLDGGETWLKPEKVIETHGDIWTWEAESSSLRTKDAGEIAYGESLTDYFTRLNKDLNKDLKYPIVRDKRTVSDKPEEVSAAQAFRNWYWIAKVQPVYESSTFDASETTGILYNAKDADTTWADFQTKNLQITNMITLGTQFGTANYDLNISANDLWTYQVNGVDKAPTDGKLVVPNGSKVTLVTAIDSGKTISNWELLSKTGVTVTQRYLGGNVVYYDFTMPACDVTAVYRATIPQAYIDIAKGAITFDEDADPAGTGLKYDGFWHSQRLFNGTTENKGLNLLGMTPLAYDAQKGYFYIWDMSKPLYVTSDGVATTNQLTLVKTTTVEFSHCYLQARADYTENFVHLAFNGQTSESKLTECAAWNDAGNIIIDRSQNAKYTVNLRFDTTNTVAAIMPKQWYNGTNYEGVINLDAASAHTQLILGSVWDNSDIYVRSLNVAAYSECAPDREKDKSDYLFLGYGGRTVVNSNIYINNSTITAPSKHSRSYFGYTSISGSTVDMAGIYSNYQYTVSNSNIRIRGDFVHNVGYSFSNVKLIVEGSIYGASHREQNYGGTISGGTKIVVLGNVAEFINVTVSGSDTLLTANVIAAEEFTIQGGTVVTNMLTSQISRSRVFGTDGLIPKETVSIGTGYGSEDNYPFAIALHDNHIENNVYSGGTMYLTGYYPGTKAAGATFDGYWTAMDDSNPVGAFIKGNQLVGANGRWNDAATVSNFSSMTSYSGGGECIVFGNSAFNNTVAMVDHTFNGATIYAAGNITLFNDTYVKSGTINCKGTFSSKLDLMITGGTIIATEIGNSYNLTEEAENTNLRWQKTIITGGNLTADRIGALTKSYGTNTVASRSTLEISDSVTLNGNPVLVCDTRINYFADENTFAAPQQVRNDNFRATGTDYQNLQAATSTTFDTPVLKDSGANGIWLLDSLSGDRVDSISKTAEFLYDGSTIETKTSAYAVRENINLFAVKSDYTLFVRAGFDLIAEMTVNSNSVTLSDTVSVPAGNKVVITLKDTSMADKFVIWYADATGKLYNVMPKVTTSNGKAVISFEMPYANAEVFIADEISLYLNKNDICITSNGFELEYSNAPENRKFVYSGSLIITDSRITTTKANASNTLVLDNTNSQTYTTTNRVRITANTGSRRVTFTKVIQIHERDTYSVYLEDNINVNLYVDGVIRMGVIHLPYNSTLTMEGVHNNTNAEKPGDQKFDDLIVMSAKTEDAFIRAPAGSKVGTYTGRYLQYCVEETSRRLVESKLWTDRPFTLENCKYITKYFYYRANVFMLMDTVLLKNCYFYIEQRPDTSNEFANVGNMVVDSSQMYFVLGAGRGSHNPFRAITKTEIVGNSYFEVTEQQATGEIYMAHAVTDKQVIVGGNATLKFNQRLMLPNLTVKDNGKVIIDGNGYLFCKNLNVKDNAQVHAGYILASGYFEHTGSYDSSAHKTPTAVQSALAADSNMIVNGASFTGIVIEGGTVAASNLIGGDKNAKLTISGGTVTAPKIGTYGAVFGYASYIPKSGTSEPWCYTYAKIPTGATVTVTGGTVNVDEYMGGMNSDVNIQGGTVNLDTNAVLGMTDDHAQTLKAHYATLGLDVAEQDNINVNISGGEVLGADGTINTPYGKTDITGENTGVVVKRISAIYGDVCIRDSKGKYDNPMNGMAKIGIHVLDTLIAQNISITNGAQVFAQNALADAPLVNDQATLFVGDTSTIYTEVYGSSGQGGVKIEGSSENIVQTQRQYVITYIMNDDDTDRATNHTDNPDTFVYNPNIETATPVVLFNPLREGFVFKGWYPVNNGVVAENPIERFSTTTNNDVILHAKWEPIKVKFQIFVDTSKTFVGTDEELASMGSIISQKNGIVTFTVPVEVPYRANMFGTEGDTIILDDFNFPSYSILRLQVADQGMSQELDIASATVTRELLKAYQQKNLEPILLKAIGVSKKNEMLTMDLNIKNGRPVDAAFQPNDALSSGNTISARVAVGDKIASASGLVINGKLNQPTAPGYRFDGWNTSANGEGTTITVDYTVGGDNATNFFAQWTPNQYEIEFDSDGGFVTKDNNSVLTGDAKLPAYVIYDQQIDGHISYTPDNKTETNNLPFAWKPGYHFEGWSYTVNGETKLLSNTDAFNETTLGDMPLDISGNVLTLKAVYTPVKVTYHTNGGIFTQDWLAESGATQMNGAWVSETKAGVTGYGLPLAGYIEKPEDNQDYQLLGAARDAGKYFAVLSTTAEYFKDYSYLPNDYRFEIGKKGYTFQGWNTEADGNGSYVGSLPAYKDIALYAIWTPNSYSLNLHKGDSQYSDLLSKSGAPGSSSTITVKVGETIADSTNWPNRDQWYVTAKAELVNAKNDERYLLGFTFDKLEPGAPSNDPNDTTSTHSIEYRNYAAFVTKLINNKALMTKTETISGGEAMIGSIFHLPADSEYNNGIISDTDVVPDYPNGYSIDMYAVYRERSLVFIQWYVDNNNQTREQVMYTAPITSVYNDYPAIYADSNANKQVEDQGYSLVRWAVNDVTGVPYTEGDYASKYESWKNDAAAKGSYDINVYTVYAAQVKNTIDLTVVDSPAILYVETIYSIPSSMTVDYLHYQITNKTGALELVGLEELKSLRYTDGNQNKVAVSMELIDPNGVSTETIWLDENVDDNWYSEIMAGRGWKLRFRAYTSRVIQIAETLSFNLGITFKQEQSQTINLLTNVVMKPTLWTVKYTAHLPNEEHRYVDNNEYSGTSDFRTAIDNSWIYGSELKSSIPTVEGYSGIGEWTHTSGNVAYGAPGTMTLTSSDTIELSTSYKVNSYQMTNATDGMCNVTPVGAVNYHTPVIITPGTTNPAFIWLEYDGSRYRLDQLKDAYPFFATVNDGVYTILMPADNVKLVYDDEMTLYLDEGTIEITQTGYTHHKATGIVTETWPGNYRILQDADNNTDFHATPNVLRLSDDLSSRKIELGNLNITSDDSVELTEGAKVILNATGNINAKNMLVPGVTTALTLQSLDTTKHYVVLYPAENVAAIGGGNENGGNAGSIKLQNLNLTLKMPPDSMASGIGSGSVGAGVCGPIAINNCEITVMEGNEVGKDPYRGVWIGGQNADSINLNGVALHDGGSGNVIALTDAKTVKIQNCTIGALNNRIMNHLIRGGTVWVDNSDIYLSSGQETLIKPKDVFHVDANNVGPSIISITGYCEQLYNGKLQIHNVATDVVISNTRLLELNNGDIKITASGSTQGNAAAVLSHDAGYRLLSAFGDYQKTSDVEIAGLNGTSYVTTEANCGVDQLKISGDAEIRPIGLLQANNVDIALDTKLTVIATGTAGLNPASMIGKGNYYQSGGQLRSENDLVIGGDMTLNEVTVQTDKAVGSSGASGVTTVSITKSNIKATTIGAVGPQNESFTFVVLDDASKLDGKLVQDHYRLHYNLSDPNFKQVDGVPFANETDKLPTVLRSETPYTEGTAGTRTYLDAIPENPHYLPTTGTSYFSNWYIEAGSVKSALSSVDVPGFTLKTTLSVDSMQYAETTVPNDGTKTLKVYSWMNMNGTGVIAYGRELNLLSKNGLDSTTQIETNGAWTARFDISGVVLEGAEYYFTFDTAIPAGTKLTLRFGDTNPKYYRYVTTAVTTVVEQSKFILMGTDDTKAVLMGTVGTTMEHVLQLSADFEDAEAVANGVALTVQSNSGIHPIAKVNYTTKAMATASCTVTETTVSYTVTPNSDSRLSGSKLYLVAKLSTGNADVSVPYRATLRWNGIDGTWIGGNMAYFPLGDYDAKNETGSWSVTGLEGGTYTITWYLTTASDNTQNVFEKVLASDYVTITAANRILPSLDVKLVSVNGSAVTSYVLNVDESHTVHFTFTTNGSDVRVSLEKQRTLQNFTQIGQIITGTVDSADITIPAGAGVYRIRFSLDGFGNISSDWDDVYFTFILK